jgi:formylglycine-generating enzyme required for sulfatase activity
MGAEPVIELVSTARVSGADHEAGERQEWEISGVTFAFRWIPAGRFVMGSSENVPCWGDDEIQHIVVITKGFWMKETEVTQEEWEVIMESNPSNFKGSNLPVESVSWSDVEDFLEKLSTRGGGRYRLPTEAEWEYAAKAGRTGSFGFVCEDYTIANCGSSAACLEPFAWYGSNSNGTTHPVGSKRPNAWGLYDISGNVWEWVWDWYWKYEPGIVRDPQGPPTGKYRVLRGGSWPNVARNLRVTDRGGFVPTEKKSSIGFRCVRDPD